MVRLVSFAVALALLVVPAAHATANSITITTVVVYQNAGFTSVDLVAHPGAIVEPTFAYTTLLVFGIFFSKPDVDTPVHFDLGSTIPSTWNVMSTTVTLGGGSVNIVVDSFDPGPCCYTPTPGTLSILFDGSTSSYEFTLVDPAPEPGTWVLATTAVGLLIARARRRRGRRVAR